MSTAIRDIAHRATGVNTGFSHVSVGFAANDVQYSYDANGNQVQKVKGDKTQTFIFDVRNQMRASPTTQGRLI